ncbi:hypothetical protein Ddye_013416 [Dipteronia dyeriana]|uniref:Uncharacterized protein n=1 Tax=Dipteronia dyeriana TaxID=168575 RepID=A0AAE0CJL6_9ROSI|nr:hypothetical protein Ddye_013416 [Dipteronia dyeriana]
MKLFEHKPFDPRAVMGFGILNGISIGLLTGFNSVGFYKGESVRKMKRLSLSDDIVWLRSGTSLRTTRKMRIMKLLLMTFCCPLMPMKHPAFYMRDATICFQKS